MAQVALAGAEVAQEVEVSQRLVATHLALVPVVEQAAPKTIPSTR